MKPMTSEQIETKFKHLFETYFVSCGDKKKADREKFDSFCSKKWLPADEVKKIIDNMIERLNDGKVFYSFHDGQVQALQELKDILGVK